MAIVFAIFGFVTGLTVSSAAAALALSGGAHTAYWALANRHPYVQRIVKLSIVTSIVAWGVVFAYLGYLLV
ncbi:MAG TPA: hypothetical protein VGX03_08115 [Candidatus Binatia bacterium]|nr:hypothetical protein [Candidatus Binatia bacterium]